MAYFKDFSVQAKTSSNKYKSRHYYRCCFVFTHRQHIARNFHGNRVAEGCNMRHGYLCARQTAHFKQLHRKPLIGKINDDSSLSNFQICDSFQIQLLVISNQLSENNISIIYW